MTARPLHEAHVRLVRDEPLTAAGEIARGQEAERTGRRGEARAHYERALSLLRGDDGDSVAAAMLLRRISFTYQVDLDLDSAEDCATAALAVSTACADEAGIGHATNLLAILEWRRGRVEEAERLYIAARTSARRCGDVRLAAMTSQNLGVLASMGGDLRGALRFYHSSLADYRALGLSAEMMRALNNLGMLYTDLERWEAAQRSYAEAVEIGTLSGDLSALITVHLNVATMWIAREDMTRAAEAAARADEIATKLDDRHADGERARISGVLLRERGADAEAEHAFRASIDFAVRHADLSLEADASRELAELYRRQGRNRDAMQFLARAHRLFSQLRSRREIADVERRNARLESEFLGVVQKWGESIEAKDLYTHGHCERVSDLACALAARAGVPVEGMFWFRIGALLHDVGKLVVPSDVLNKPGPLTVAEWEIIRTHPAAGVALLSDVDFPGDVMSIVRSHHERWSGGGYPDGLVGEAIPLAARIVCIADVYDALTSERSYQMPYTHLEAMEIMRREVGRRFDPALFGLFESLMQEGERRVRASQASARGVSPAVPGDDTDDLTGVLTRRSFIDTVASALAGRPAGAAGAMLVLDIDLFKRVNDAFGHLRGDDVLRAVADVLRAQLEDVGAVGRFAGDEFVAWLPLADQDEARATAESIRDAVQRRRIPATETTPSIGVTVSIGVATVASAGRSFEELFAAADRAMYEAKRAGRNQTGSSSVESAHPEPTLTSERFVGRGRELEQLAMLLDETMRRRPQILLLSGDAGVGKTTLLRQLATDVRLRNGLFVSGQCFESDLRPPYGPWIETLSTLADASVIEARAWTELPRLVPSLGAPGAEAPPSKYALYEEVTEFLRLVSAAQPLTLVLEDMQWADAAAWDLLEHVRSRLSSERLLICLTVRDTPARVLDAERRARLSRDERLRTMHLGPLTAAEVRIWLESVLERRDLAPELLSLVTSRSEGNPLLVNQLLRAMLDGHALWHDGARWQWRLPLDVALPTSSHDLFARRIARLTPLSRRILAVAAIVGRRFDVDLVMTAGGWSEDDVLEAIDDGLSAGVVEIADVAGGTDGGQYGFSHGLLREVLRAAQNPRRVQRVHERVAEALERRNPAAAAELAEHYDRAGNDARAFEHAMRAGHAAADVHAPEDAITFFQTASRHARTAAQRIRAVRAVVQAAERMGSYARCEGYCDAALAELADVLAPEQRLWLQIQRARVRFHTGATPTETLAVSSQLMAEAEALSSDEDRATVAILQSQAFARCGESEAAEVAATAAVHLAEHGGNESLLITALLRQGTMILERDPDQALVVFRRALTCAESAGDAYAEARCRIAVGVACARAQHDDAANTAYETAGALARRIHAPDLAGLAALNLGVLRLHAGEFAQAREQLSEAVKLFAVVQNEPNRLAALYNAASVERECGNAGAASDLYTRARDLATKLGFRDVALGAAAGAGLAAVRLGHAERALDAVALLRAEMAAEGDRWFQGREMIEALFVRTAIDRGDYSGAERQFWSAMALAERHDQYGAAWFVAEVVTDLVDGGCHAAWKAAEQFAPAVAKLGYSSLSARYMVLRDLAQRDPHLTPRR